jgi:hypothetical protein
MISPNNMIDADTEPSVDVAITPHRIVLARYGLVPQVARFGVSQTLFESVQDALSRGTSVVVESDRGPEIATLLEVVREGLMPEDATLTGPLLRIATEEDLNTHATHRRQCERNFFDWQERIDGWQLQLQIIDLEQTLDPEKIILYVLNGQDAETTRLALLVAAAGLGIVHVQPVSAEGIVQQTSGGGGCGSGGCGSGGCH